MLYTLKRIRKDNKKNKNRAKRGIHKVNGVKMNLKSTVCPDENKEKARAVGKQEKIAFRLTMEKAKSVG